MTYGGVANDPSFMNIPRRAASHLQSEQATLTPQASLTALEELLLLAPALPPPPTLLVVRVMPGWLARLERSSARDRDGASSRLGASQTPHHQTPSMFL